MTSVEMHAIAANRLTAAQRQAIQTLVKEQANGWWHGFDDLWIVGGKSVKAWRDLLMPLMDAGGASVLVFKVEAKEWAAYSTLNKANVDWLKKNL